MVRVRVLLSLLMAVSICLALGSDNDNEDDAQHRQQRQPPQTAAPAAFVLDLAPAAPVATQAFANSSLSSWGGNAAKYAGDNKYHLFASAMTQGCNLGSWKTNSEVIHAVSDTPTGPFKFVEVVLGRWHHNPQLFIHPDGTWMILSMSTVGAGTEARCKHLPLGRSSSEAQLGEVLTEPDVDLIGSGPPWNCTTTGRGYCLSNGAACQRPPGCRVCCGEWTQLHYASGPGGPWTYLNSSQNISIPGIFAGTNPSPVVCGLPSTGPCGRLANGSAVSNGTMVVWGHDGVGLTGWMAPTWRGPYTPVPGHLFVFPRGVTFEDPYLWWDRQSQRWRALLHQYRSGIGASINVGGTAVSVTPELFGPWRYQAPTTPAYTEEVHQADGTTIKLARRERPKLMLGENGEPQVLFTGVCPPEKGLCFTHAQSIIRSNATPPRKGTDNDAPGPLNLIVDNADK